MTAPRAAAAVGQVLPTVPAAVARDAQATVRDTASGARAVPLARTGPATAILVEDVRSSAKTVVVAAQPTVRVKALPARVATTAASVRTAPSAGMPGVVQAVTVRMAVTRGLALVATVPMAVTPGVVQAVTVRTVGTRGLALVATVPMAVTPGVALVATGGKAGRGVPPAGVIAMIAAGGHPGLATVEDVRSGAMTAGPRARVPSAVKAGVTEVAQVRARTTATTVAIARAVRTTATIAVARAIARSAARVETTVAVPVLVPRSTVTTGAAAVRSTVMIAVVRVSVVRSTVMIAVVRVSVVRSTVMIAVVRVSVVRSTVTTAVDQVSVVRSTVTIGAPPVLVAARTARVVSVPPVRAPVRSPVLGTGERAAQWVPPAGVTAMTVVVALPAVTIVVVVPSTATAVRVVRSSGMTGDRARVRSAVKDATTAVATVVEPARPRTATIALSPVTTVARAGAAPSSATTGPHRDPARSAVRVATTEARVGTARLAARAVRSGTVRERDTDPATPGAAHPIPTARARVHGTAAMVAVRSKVTGIALPARSVPRCLSSRPTSRPMSWRRTYATSCAPSPTTLRT
ncbi:hypothetical protein [Sphaerisporangium flaviroseum]|uniref:hypothetical protein n=1 Tax=Sphaerisporangium flaviroseum TaxID=509199 RepID=UPI0031EDD770